MYRQGCGEISYLDIKEQSPGGIQRFRQRLLNSTTAVREKSQEQYSPTRPAHPPRAHLNPSTNPAQARTEAPQSLPHYRSSQPPQLQNSQSDSTIFLTDNPHYLLLCVNTRNSTALVHIDVSSLTSEQYMFQRICQEYQRIRDEHGWGISKAIPLCIHSASNAISARLPELPNFLSFFSRFTHKFSQIRIHKISSGDFVRVSSWPHADFSKTNDRKLTYQFQLIPIGMDCCPSWFETNQFPPETEVMAQRYTYEPVPMHDDVRFRDIPLPHLLKPGPHTDEFWKTMFPKKIRDPLIRQSGHNGQHVIGWGIRINESLDWTALLFSILLGLVTISVVVIVYAVTTANDSSAFGLGAFMAALFTVYMTYQYSAWREA